MAYKIEPLYQPKQTYNVAPLYQPKQTYNVNVPPSTRYTAPAGALMAVNGNAVNNATKNNAINTAVRGTVAGAGNAMSGQPVIQTQNAIQSGVAGALAGANMGALGGNAVSRSPSDNGSSYDGGGGSGAGAIGYQSAPVVDPYADIYALYDSLFGSQRDALAQERDARLRGLQANYQNAKSRLDSSFNSGETELNQNADRALREAYIENMLNQRALNQQLAMNGIVGGAAESVLARAFNNYGNNRNEIERGRMDDLRSLLANYQNTAGDIENAYLQGMANADADYAGSIGSAMQNYYNNLINMQQQNIANQYRNQLGKSGSSSRSTSANDTLTSNGLNKKTIVSTLGKFADDPESLVQYSASLGLGGDELNDLYWQAGINPSTVGAPANPTQNPVQRANILASVPLAVRQRLLSYLDNSRGQVYGDDSRLMAALQTYGRQNGLSEEQVRAILAEAGY